MTETKGKDMPYSKEAQDIRQKVLEDYRVLGDVHDEGLDRIVKLAALICHCETSFISFLDWRDRLVRMNHRYGLDQETAPIIPGETFCDSSVMGDGCLCLKDAKLHPVYGKSRFVVGEPYISFYFSVGLVLDSDIGVPVGVLCVIDKNPRELSENQKSMMHLLAQDIVMHLQYKRTLRKVQEYVQELLAKNQGLERAFTDKAITANDLASVQQKMNSQFVATLGHELRTPTNIVQCSVILLESTTLQKEQEEYVQMAQEGCRQLQRILDKSVEHMDVKSHLATTTLVPFSVSRIIQELVKEHSNPKMLGHRVLHTKLAGDLPGTFVGDCAKIFQILRYFLENAIKFTESDTGVIDICVSRSKYHCCCGDSTDSCTDNTTDTNTDVSSTGSANSSPITVNNNNNNNTSNNNNNSSNSNNNNNSNNNSNNNNNNNINNNHNSDSASHDGNSNAKEIMYIDFSVCDNGIGVPRETYALLFKSLMQGDRSSTRKHGGMGLGLAISYDLATLMNGSVRVTTKHGDSFLCMPGMESDLPHDQGACFTLTVPLEVTSLPATCSELLSPVITRSSPLLRASSGGCSPEIISAMFPPLDIPTTAESVKELIPSPPTSPPSVDFPALTKGLNKALKILVVEDNLLNQKVINHMLLKLGYKADYVHDGAKAVAKYCQTPVYNLILMDLHMPVMDGLTATRIILDLARGLDKPTSIVAVTSSVSQEDRDNCEAIGMSGYLEKPISLKSLLKVLQNVEGRALALSS